MIAIVATVAGCAAVVPPTQDAFYQPPTPLPAGALGDIVRSRTGVFTPNANEVITVSGVRSWQVLYRSQSATGTDIAVSGTVLVPSAPWPGPGPRPLLDYAVAARGLGDDCAPSYTLSNGKDTESIFISSALNLGWAVAVSDMEGLGTPGLHTYEVGQSQGRTILDMARAAQRLGIPGIDANTPVGVWGYSSGGTTAMWAAELAPTYAPELKIAGVAAGGVPGDPAALAAALDGSPYFFLMADAAAGFDAAYPELDLRSFMNAQGMAVFDAIQTQCVDEAVTNPVLDLSNDHITDYMTSNPLLTPAWKARLAQNELGTHAPTAPVYQFHAEFDQVTPLGEADVLRKTYCDAHVNVTWQVVPLTEHISAAVFGAPGAVAFLADRFAGKPVTGNC